jgi:hypothetical protein
MGEALGVFPCNFHGLWALRLPTGNTLKPKARRTPVMKSLLTAAALAAALCIVSPSRATVDGGVTAHLIGTAQEGRFAIVAESSVQESCQYGGCLIYVVDTSQMKFKRTQLVELPSRYSELIRSLCGGRESDACMRQVNAQMMLEEQDAGVESRILIKRYLDALTVWNRAKLGNIHPPPEPVKLKAVEGFSRQGPPLMLDEWGLQIHLRERWTAPSFRATTEGEVSCNPTQLTSCSQEVRWEDGRRKQAWVCAAPAQGKSEADCSGRASFVRVEAGFDMSQLSEGRSSWVEPGRLAQSHMSLVTDRSVKLDTLMIARHSIHVYRLPRAFFVTGGFAHGMYENGTWFPVVVAVPLNGGR